MVYSWFRCFQDNENFWAQKQREQPEKVHHLPRPVSLSVKLGGEYVCQAQA